MFIPTKIEQNLEINILLSNPIYKKLFCKEHGFLFQYKCLHYNCNAFICGKIQCIDAHFHQSQLKIQKFNSKDLISNIKRLQELSKISEMLIPIIDQLKKTIDHLKQRSTNVFKNYKIFKSISDSLIKQLDEPLDEDYLSSMDQFQIIRLRIQEQLISLGRSINWKTVWITLQDEVEIAQKLKISFVEFKNVYFQVFQTNLQLLEIGNKNAIIQDHQCQGLLLLYYTHQLYLIGEFIPNNNIETCKYFIPNFLFVVNNQGEVQQYNTSKKVMTFYKPYKESIYRVRIINQQICEKQGVQELNINKMLSFLVHAEVP